MVSAGPQHSPPVRHKWLLILREPLVLGLAISLSIHLLAYGGWRIGRHYQLIPANFLPNLLQRLQSANQPKTIRTPNPPAQPQLLFVDVSPDQFTAEPPKNPKYYGAVSTKAANPDVRVDSDQPKIDGKQDKVLKTSEPAKLQPKPLEPTPKPEPERQEKQLTDAAPKPKQEVLPGDLALVKPSEGEKKGEDKKEKDLDQRETGNDGSSRRERPRTLAEARGRPTERMKQDGGVRQLSMSSSLDVKGTVIGMYDAEFIAAVEARWLQLIDEQNVRASGKVAVEFRLHQDGRITNAKETEATVKDIIPTLICRRAILDPAPFKKWPAEMRREMNADFRDVTFTFYYLTP